MGASLHGENWDSWSSSWSRHDSYDVMIANLHGSQGRSIVEFLIQECLICCLGIKLVWNTREIQCWTSPIGMTFVMQWQLVCIQNKGGPWLKVWYRDDLYDGKAAACVEKIEICGWTPGPNMTHMILQKQVCMQNKGVSIFVFLILSKLRWYNGASLHGKIKWKSVVKLPIWCNGRMFASMRRD